MSCSRRERGAVLILVVGILAATLMLVIAFLFVVRVERLSSGNALDGARAELAAQAGLLHALAAVDWYYAHPEYAVGLEGARAEPTGTPPPAPSSAPGDWHAGWHRYFAPDDPADGLLVADAGGWLRHDGRATPTPPALRGRVLCLPDAQAPAARYAVAVVDLDGKLHTNPNRWATELTGDPARLDGFLAPVADALGLDAAARDRLRGPTPLASPAPSPAPSPARPYRAPAEIAPGVLSPTDLADPEKNWKKYGLEGFLTPYPVLDETQLNPPPPVNVNTARSEVLDALLAEIPSLRDHQDTRDLVRDLLIEKRPFHNRAELEATLAALAPPHEADRDGELEPRGTDLPELGGGDSALAEKQFNDLLNALNGVEPSFYAANSNALTGDRGLPGSAGEGVYEFDFDPPTPPPPPTVTPPPQANTGGETSLAPPREASWGQPVSFSSRYYHVYVVAEALVPERAEEGTYAVRATRRLHAIYDVVDRRLLYCRWTATARGNLGDLGP